MITAQKWVAVGFGGPEVLRNIEVGVPDPGPGQVRIDVRAAGLNPADAKHVAPGQDPKLLPLSIGYEVAGIVDVARARYRTGLRRRGGRRRGGRLAGHRGRDGAAGRFMYVRLMRAAARPQL